MNEPKRLLDDPSRLSIDESAALEAGVGLSPPAWVEASVWTALAPLAAPTAGAAPAAVHAATAGANAVQVSATAKGVIAVGLFKFFVAGAIGGTTLAAGLHVAHRTSPSTGDMTAPSLDRPAAAGSTRALTPGPG